MMLLMHANNRLNKIQNHWHCCCYCAMAPSVIGYNEMEKKREPTPVKITCATRIQATLNILLNCSKCTRIANGGREGVTSLLLLLTLPFPLKRFGC